MVIENIQELENIVSGQKVICYAVPASDRFHPKLTSTIALYFNCNEQSYLVPMDHPEGINIPKSEIIQILKKAEDVFVPDKKEFLYHFPIGRAKDLRLGSNKYAEYKGGNKYHTWMYGTFGDHPEVNKMFAILKLYEYVKEANVWTVEALSNFEPKKDFEFYNDIAAPVFFLLEQQGLRVEYQPFIDLFKPYNPDYNIRNNIAYTSYNLYNVTSRPTNAFNSVNFAAIPKKEEYRKCFSPQNDLFVEFDFDGYHLRLIANEIDYELTPESAHTQLAKEYLNKTELSKEEYEYAKQVNFQAVYGNVPKEFESFKFFDLIKRYINGLWITYEEQGYVNAPISQKHFDSSLEEMYPKKLFNYWMQSLETSRNILILKEVLQFLQDKKTKVALYTYDSILFDFSIDDGKQLLIDLENILSEKDAYPVKFKYSKNLVL